jgi:hypothetical protein
MRVRTVDFWRRRIEAELKQPYGKQTPRHRHLPRNFREEQNYEVASYLASKPNIIPKQVA